MTGLLSSPQTLPYVFSPGKRMRAVNFVRGAMSLGNRVEMRWARAAGAWVAVGLENGGKDVVMFDVYRDSWARGASMRRRGRGGLTDALWRAVRLEALLADDATLVEGPDAGALKEAAAKLLDGVKRSSSLGSDDA